MYIYIYIYIYMYIYIYIYIYIYNLRYFRDCTPEISIDIRTISQCVDGTGFARLRMAHFRLGSFLIWLVSNWAQF